MGDFERVVTKLITPHRWSVSALFRSLTHTATAQCSLGSIQYSLSNEQLDCSNSGKTICVAISKSWTESIVLSGTGVPSKSLYTEPDESSLHDTLDSSKINYNVIPLICDVRFSDKIFVGTFDFPEKSHMDHKFHFP